MLAEKRTIGDNCTGGFLDLSVSDPGQIFISFSFSAPLSHMAARGDPLLSSGL